MSSGSPHPPQTMPYVVLVIGSDNKRINGAEVVLAGITSHTGPDGAAHFNLDQSMINTSMIVRAKGYKDFWYGQPNNIHLAWRPQNIVVGGYAAPTDIYAGNLSPNVPAIPTREQICGINIHFQGGQVINSSKYGLMPWYPPALSWCDPATRQQVYQQMIVDKDTHCIIEVPSGDPLYPENDQFYNTSRFPNLDWTNGSTDLINSPFLDLVDEVVANIGRFIILMDERVDYSTKIVQLVFKALNSRNDYRRSQYGMVGPGYDGVFYGWDPNAITNWANIARALDPNCYLCMEHDTGHIPLGNGEADYAPNGGMSGFDTVMGEFAGDSGPFPYGPISTQIVGRMIKPYNQDVNNPIDPGTPFYLVDSSRGPRYYCCMETWDPYNWVRTDMTSPPAIQAAQARIQMQRQYYIDRGSKYNG